MTCCLKSDIPMLALLSSLTELNPGSHRRQTFVSDGCWQMFVTHKVDLTRCGIQCLLTSWQMETCGYVCHHVFAFGKKCYYTSSL